MSLKNSTYLLDINNSEFSKSNETKKIIVLFNNQNIITLEKDNKLYDVMKPICINLGLD